MQLALVTLPSYISFLRLIGAILAPRRLLSPAYIIWQREEGTGADWASGSSWTTEGWYFYRLLHPLLKG